MKSRSVRSDSDGNQVGMGECRDLEKTFRPAVFVIGARGFSVRTGSSIRIEKRSAFELRKCADANPEVPLESMEDCRARGVIRESVSMEHDGGSLWNFARVAHRSGNAVILAHSDRQSQRQRSGIAATGTRSIDHRRLRIGIRPTVSVE